MEVFLPALNKSIPVRGMKVKEINLLTDRSKALSGESIDTILKSCIEDESVDFSKMLSCDRNALLIGVRRATWGDEYDIRAKCRYCSERSEYTVDLSKLEVNVGNRELVDQSILDPAKLHKYEFPECKTVAHWKFLGGDDFQKAMGIQKTKGDRATSELLMLKIKSVDGLKDKGVPLKVFVEDLSAGDLQSFNDYYSDSEPGLDSDIELVCQNGLCCEKFTVFMPIEPENFFKRSAKKKL